MREAQRTSDEEEGIPDEFWYLYRKVQRLWPPLLAASRMADEVSGASRRRSVHPSCCQRKAFSVFVVIATNESRNWDNVEPFYQ